MLQKVIIGNGVTSVGTYAFNSCYSIETVTMPDSVTNIGNNAFYYCYSFVSITISNSATSIGSDAFYSCFSIASVTIPNLVTIIGANAFGNCHGVKEYHLKPISPPTLSNANAFSSISSDCIIFVPNGSLESYKTATNWSKYANKMQEEP